MIKYAEKVPKGRVIKFLENIEHNEVKNVNRLEEAPAQISILDLVLAFEDHQKNINQSLRRSTHPENGGYGEIQSLD